MAKIHAPFNFVPLTDKVFFPDWAGQISQDVPFSDGVSGSLQVNITAESPIFVRNGHNPQDAEAKNDTYQSFSKSPDGRYFIPATSVKGAIRNVLEIITSSKMGAVKNDTFGIRDLSNSADGIFYRDKIKPESIHCGWLYATADAYELEDCGIPWRIGADEIDNHLGLGLEDFIVNGDLKEDSNRTAQVKYELAAGVELEYNFESDEDLRKAKSVGSRQFVRFSDNGEPGTIVFTGQSSKRKIGTRKNKKGQNMWEGKFYEFVFPKLERPHIIEIPESVYNAFVSVHQNSPDYKNYWKQKLRNNERIPVFFRLNEDGSIESIGLSYMFKYPAYNSVFNALRSDDLKTDKMDMAECMFGKTSKTESLKGRIMFGHAWCTSLNPTVLHKRDLILSTPHSSYYPLYVGGGSTWNSDSTRIAGRKRYPTRKTLSKSTEGTTDMLSTMTPLDAGTSFTEVIRFHNLKKVELGALLYALTFGGHEECRHSLGSAKPYGYGSAKLSVEKLNVFGADEALSSYMDCFTETIEPWQNEAALKELFLMAAGIPKGRESEFEYMHMDTDRSKNQFLEGKDVYSKGEQMGLFSQILNGSVPRCAVIGNVSANKQRVDVEAQMAREREKFQKYAEKISQVETAISAGNLDEAIVYLEKARELTIDCTRINVLEEIIVSEKKKIAAIKEEESRKQKEAELKASQEKKAAGGIAALLNEKYELGPNEGKFKVASFKVCMQKVESWMKAAKTSQLSEEQKQQVIETVQRLISSPDKKEIKDIQNRGSKLWTKLNDLLGKELCDNL